MFDLREQSRVCTVIHQLCEHKFPTLSRRESRYNNFITIVKQSRMRAYFSFFDTRNDTSNRKHNSFHFELSRDNLPIEITEIEVIMSLFLLRKQPYQFCVIYEDIYIEQMWKKLSFNVKFIPITILN